MMNINLIHFLYELSDCFTELSSHRTGGFHVEI